MEDENYEKLFKVLIIGDSGVGKSSIMLRYCDDSYEQSYMSTIGVDFKIKSFKINDKVYKIQIWDTAGQERFHTITTSYYRGASGIILVYDITDRTTFTKLSDWIEEIHQHSQPNVPIIFVGNKCDLIDNRQVSYTESKEFAQSKSYEYIESSAKTNTNIDDLFVKIIQQMDNKDTDIAQNIVINKEMSCCIIN